jgi:hypothetical protein
MLINCVYSLSGTYGLLPRLLYYCTLIFAVFGRSKEWLVIGALVSALTYAGTAAIHAIFLVTSKVTVFNLDVIGTWSVLSSGSIAYIVMVHWSTTLRNSRARMVMVLWGFLIGVALLFSRSTLIDTPLSPGEPACYSNTGRLLRYPMQLIDPQFNCTYKCFSARKPMRNRSEIIAVPRHVVDNHYSRLALVSVVPVMIAAYSAIAWDSREHSPSQLLTRFVMSKLDPKHHEEIVRNIYNVSQEQWYGGYIALYTYTRRTHWTWLKFWTCGVILPWFVLTMLVDMFCIPLFIINVVLNELTLLRSGIPTNEANKAIGQWGTIVSSMLVVIAACVNKSMEEWEKRKQRKKQPRNLDEETITVVGAGEGEVEVGQINGQSIGVVKPKMAHVQTLRDERDWMTTSK